MSLLLLLASYFLLTVIKGQKYSSLQVSDYNIVLTYSQYPDYGFSNGNYELEFKIPFESDSVPQIIYCWKKMKTVPQKGQQNCDLIQDELQYRCIEVNYTRDNPYQYDQSSNNITVTWTEFTFSSSKGIVEVGNSSKLIYVSAAQTLSRLVVMEVMYFDKFSVYHMITATSREILVTYQQKNTQAKLSFVHTYTSYDFYDSLISQRNYYCILYDNKIIYIFQGAVSRGNQLHFFTGVLTTTDDNVSFHMWGGYSYSSGHAARDMFGYESYTQNFYDMYSLYAAAPFQDVADNIKGKKNAVRIGNSGPSTLATDTKPPFHFIQFYRLFDTLDAAGDEIIQDKIYNRFCYAAYFQNFEDPNTVSSLSVLNNSFKHQLIDCHIPDLIVFDKNLKIVKSLIVFLTLLIVLFG